MPFTRQLRSMKSTPVARETALFIAFLLLTLLMTWPWARNLRDAIPDPGDPYVHAYFLWWDYHQTFHDPLHLFEATMFYPYHGTLAFSESDYGIALLCFPLFALGLRPLTVEILATLFGFAFTAYGAFRLARTLGLTRGGAWVAGIVFAFVPYRFNQLSHLPIIFTGWMPLLLEALVLFTRERSWKRAAWLGLCFLMNALTCLTWFVLTTIPLALSGLFLLALHRGAWRDRRFWLRLCASLAAALAIFSPFLRAYYSVSRTFGFVRSEAEVAEYSAHLVNWLATEERNKLWHGLGVGAIRNEMVLFPGLLPLLLLLAALLIVHRNGSEWARHVAHRPRRISRRRALLLALDALVVLSGVCALLVIGYGGLEPGLGGIVLFKLNGPTIPLALLFLIVVVRCALAPPEIFRRAREADWSNLMRPGGRAESFGLGLIWAIVGFLGSLGMNSFFHRALYEFIPLFRGMRVAARWSIIAYLGLALLAGLGAAACAGAVGRYWPNLRRAAYALLIVALLFEQRVAPLQLTRGQADPDALTLRLKETKMRGGLVELPVGPRRTFYMARAADHGHPIVTAINSFVPPVVQELAALAATKPVPDRLMDLLESIPASYLTVHNGSLDPQSRVALEAFLARAVQANRLRFIRSYRQGRSRDDLYAVVKTEPQAQSEAPPPAPLSHGELNEWLADLPVGFREDGFLIYRLYKASYGCMPTYAEFVRDAPALAPDEHPESIAQRFINNWTTRPEFREKFAPLTDEEFIETLLANIGAEGEEANKLRDGLRLELKIGLSTRADLLLDVVYSEPFNLREFNSAFVLLHYFAYLKRDPEEDGHKFWLSIANSGVEPADIRAEFISSPESRLKQGRP